MTATHNPLVTVQVNLAAVPSAPTDFAAEAYLAEDQSGMTASEIRTYETYAAMDADSADLSARTLAAGVAAFSQAKQPSTFSVVNVDIAGGDTYADAYAILSASSTAFFLVTMESRTAADHLAIAALVTAEAKQNKFLVIQADGGTGSTVDKSAWVTLASNEYCAIIHHDDALELDDIRLSIARGAFDLDTKSPTWTGRLVGGTNATVTDGEKLALLDESDLPVFNVALPFGNAARYVDSGKNAAGRPIYEIMTVIWFEDRLNARCQALKLRLDDFGQKLGLDPSGQNQVRAEVVAQFDIAEGAQHLRAGKDENGIPYNAVSFPNPIPDVDLASQTLKATGYMTTLVGARKIALEFDFSF